MKLIFLIVVFLMASSSIFAQTGDVEMASAMRESGKIYVVVVVIAVIFIGLVIYLFSIDKRLKKLEGKD